MPKKNTRKDPITGKVFRKGEYRRSGRSGYQYRRWNPETKQTDCISAPTLEKLRKMEKEMDKDRADGIRSGSRTSLNAYFNIWKHNKRIKENVMHNYVYMYEHYVAPVFGKRDIKSIKYSEVIEFYNNLLDKEILAVNTLEVVHNVFQQILWLAVRDDIIRRNICQGALAEVKKGRPEPEKKKGLTIQEQGRLLEVLSWEQNRKHEPLILFLLNTGLRISELSGLKWSDIDYEQKLIHVRRNLKYYVRPDGNSAFVVSTTKTTASVRDIPLTDKIAGILDLQKQNGNSCDAVVVDDEGGEHSGFIFGTRFHTPVHQGTVNRIIKRIVRQANSEEGAVMLPEFSTHTLRHTIAANMVYAGVDITSAKEILGHKDISTTSNIYHTVLKEQKERDMEALDLFTEKMSVKA